MKSLELIEFEISSNNNNNNNNKPAFILHGVICNRDSRLVQETPQDT